MLERLKTFWNKNLKRGKAEKAEQSLLKESKVRSEESKTITAGQKSQINKD